MRPFNLCIQAGTINASGQIIKIIWEPSSIITLHHGPMLSMQSLNYVGVLMLNKKYQFQLQASMGVHQLQRLEPTSME